ncbi:mannitol-1-phosphate 5-dehydrogenase [Agrilactobacillus composti DSM 18527 = JCM 14202]|uniref:Mannitol-1-phosphate 5-dehydrogenase n=1 Tax=Agrilactobacillus composti DSM 18527 = JCM 14202 TaxID=1423734 RepID=X0PF83_9LACO|nr:mannitol-1-phosphate 5-dehydrogenase [Agrilactobacillus composti]KRM36719.1 mannitol-1-phosphate 5-dehydrogenase [Agrilactobacillus composti DSM 18527 = JCM 14202]GAF40519.1 mannitol-1-phosphate 5-dehydrogenase [Agrilactobacillus composti DSM 18527 = JCM 14202]
MQAVHFGAGNIGRGFIGETLASNGFEIHFVDVNSTIIDALDQRHEYDIELAAEGHKKIHVANVDGINNKDNPDKVVAAIENTDMVTTAIGPKILPFIADLIAKGISARLANNNTQPLDVIACENMIGGSQFLKGEVYKHLNDADKQFADEYIGFPNAAVDRIVPIQHHEDPLAVSVEPFKEWVIDESQMKRHDIKLDSVVYVPDLEPYIERKLFSVNSGHATVAYTGEYLGYKTIGDAIKDEKVLKQLKGALSETGDLLIHKWHFKPDELKAYQEKIISRFQNPYISDDILRVGRTPIRKLGYDERFIRPIRELKDRNLDYSVLLDTVGMIFTFDEPKDSESVELQKLLKEKPLVDVVKQVTGLKDQGLIDEVVASVENKIKTQA